MSRLLLTLTLPLFLVAFKSDKNAYMLYDTKGKQCHYAKMLDAAVEADVVLFGEQHDNPINHWLEQELTKDLFNTKKENLVMGAEMFEADDQVVVNEYLSGAITEKTFRDECKLWTNFGSDYKPLLDFAKKNKIKFIATNVPRRYANMVYSRGLEKLDSIEPEAHRWMAPLPIAYDKNLKCYQDIFNAAKGHGGENLPKSQAIKDATMAYFILKNLPDGKTFIHYNGSYHSDNFTAIVWYLQQAKPGIRIVTIGSTEQDSVDELSKENEGLADFTLVTPTSMSKTYRP